MGCGSSKVDYSPVVTLCRERRGLIRDAADLRYELATAHARYLRSLGGVGAAIKDFVAEELVTVASPPTPTSSPPIALPSGSKSDSSASPLSHCLSESDGSLKSNSPGVGASEPSSKIPDNVDSNIYHMRSSTTAIPSMIYQNPYAWDDYYRQQDDYPIGSPSRDPRDEINPTPPPPPPPAVSPWDFFNPFDSHQMFSPKYGSSSTNSSEIREREGIPDLEDENGQEIPKFSRDHGKRMDLDEGMLKSVAINEESESIDLEKGKAKDKEVILEEESSMATTATTDESGPSSTNVVAGRDGGRDIMEVVKEINGLFKSATDCGEEASRMLEVGKLNYRARSRIFRVASSRILEPTGLSTLTCSWPFKHSWMLASARKRWSNTAPTLNHNGMKSGNLSSTLEKLYVWEKKLYKEVKDEERLRVVYERQCGRLRYLDRQGAKSHKIDSTWTSIRWLEMKLSIVIKSVDAISDRMHKIRDDELQPQLIELVKGLMKMWKSMLECHQAQFQAVLSSESHKLTSKARVDGNLLANVTRELEVHLINWCSNFREWINTQKSYVEALNGWLLRWISQGEQEETPDGFVPFSPSNIGAPAVFILSNDWDNAIRRISEAQVMEAMHNFATNVHRLWESQEEEHRQKLKMEFLSREYAKRLNSLRNDNRVKGNLDVASVADDGPVNHDERLMTALELLRKRLDEEGGKHDEFVRQVQDAASNSFKIGLLPIFEALEGFCSETVRAYEGIRIIPNEGGGGPSTCI